MQEVILMGSPAKASNTLNILRRTVRQLDTTPDFHHDDPAVLELRHLLLRTIADLEASSPKRTAPPEMSDLLDSWRREQNPSP